ncbi:MAG TPA: two-component regulator propeller domain-containing protein, partial [Anaerolineales bacterium]|nr:two-component regulator propeller domain-containing protein [Anaerolineales bacterium]
MKPLFRQINALILYYTVLVKWIFNHLVGILLMLAVTACGGGITPPATPKADSAPNSPVVDPTRRLQTSLPDVCDCVLRFDHLNIEQGLSQSSVRDIFQDSRGFMWFGTEDGLNRYDGYTFKNYKPDPDKPDSISDRWITAILEDQDGYLWIGTRQGINRYDPRLETFINYQHDDAHPNSLIDNHINTLYLDHDNNLWIGTAYGLDLLERSTGNFKHYLTPPPQLEKPMALEITAIHQDQHGQLWVGTTDGLKKFNPQNNTVETYQSNSENSSTISFDHITAIAEDDHAVMWVGTKNGLNRFDPITGHFDRFQRPPSSTENPAPDESRFETVTAPRDLTYSISSNVINALRIDST